MAIQNTDKKGLNSFILRLLGSLGFIFAFYGEYSGNNAILSIRWASIAIFAFLLSEGLKHTSSYKLYIERVVLFTIISEACYNLYQSGKILDSSHQSVMVSILLCLVIFAVEKALHKIFKNVVIDIIYLALTCFGAYKLAANFGFECGGLGIIIIFIFFVASRVKYPFLVQLCGMLYIVTLVSTSYIGSFSVFGIQYPIASQWLAVAALPFIWFYNGKRGPNNIGVKIINYAIYPVTVLAFWALKTFL